MTRLERTIRQVSELRDFYQKLEKQRGRGVHTDLDHLAGTWSAAEARAFARATRVFSKLDEKIAMARPKKSDAGG